MSRKYIKGKDGKFKGSLPDATQMPAALPELPRAVPEKKESQKTIELTSGFDKDGKYVIRETEESLKRWFRLQARLD